jgi:hypothetical protein
MYSENYLVSLNLVIQCVVFYLRSSMLPEGRSSMAVGVKTLVVRHGSIHSGGCTVFVMCAFSDKTNL